MYSINEHFYSFQGEGVHSGRAAHFIRLQGCDQRCGFCDSASTWHPDWIPPNVQRLTAEETASLVTAPAGAIVVITGGEPTLYDLEPLVDALHVRGYPVHLETAGHRNIRGQFDWVTVSPKLFAAWPLPTSWHVADEIKLIVTSPDQLEADLSAVLAAPLKPNVPIWLHPEWSQVKNGDVLRAIVETVKQIPQTRAGYQLHKLFKADWLDPHSSKIPVPLGGESANGHAN